jgi:hypothetical protein
MNIAQTLSFLLPNAQWSLTSNDYSTLEWHGPDEKPSLEELEIAWQKLQSIKIWSNAQAFISEFTMQEMAAIALSTDPTIAALRLLLSGWFSEVRSNDPRVMTGLNALESNGILTAERLNLILSK